MRLEALILCASHHRAQEHSLKLAAVIGEVAMRLAKNGNNLRHIETERAVLIGESGAMTL